MSWAADVSAASLHWRTLLFGVAVLVMIAAWRAPERTSASNGSGLARWWRANAAAVYGAGFCVPALLGLAPGLQWAREVGWWTPCPADSFGFGRTAPVSVHGSWRAACATFTAVGGVEGLLRYLADRPVVWAIWSCFLLGAAGGAAALTIGVCSSFSIRHGLKWRAMASAASKQRRERARSARQLASQAARNSLVGVAAALAMGAAARSLRLEREKEAARRLEAERLRAEREARRRPRRLNVREDKRQPSLPGID